MKASVHFIDHGAKTVELISELAPTGSEEQHNTPTPAAILALATKVLFENGMLARIGQIALEGASKGENPADYVTQKYKEIKSK
jgi:hypothetical protein